MSEDIRRYITILEAQVFNWDRFKPDIINYVNKKLKGEQGVDPFYEIIVNKPQIGAGQKLGFTDALAKSWKDYFSGKSFATNGIWSQININPNLPRKNAERTYNYYITVSKNQKNIGAFIRGIPKLFEVMKKLSDEKQSPIAFKTHRLLDAFVDHNDSLKIYYYDPSLKDDIHAAVETWLNLAGVTIAPRTHTHGVDIKGANGGSFGELLAKQVAKQVDGVIAKYGSKYTAEQYYEWIKKNMDGIIKSVQVNRS